VSAAEVKELVDLSEKIVKWLYVLVAFSVAAGGWVVKLEMNQSYVDQRVDKLERLTDTQSQTQQKFSEAVGRIDERLSGLTKSLDEIKEQLRK
jgi:hypothetical protein